MVPCLFLAFAFLVAFPTSGLSEVLSGRAIVWLDGIHGNDRNSGSSPQHPVATLPVAVQRLPAGGGDIHAAPAEYAVTSPLSFKPHSLVAVTTWPNPGSQTVTHAPAPRAAIRFSGSGRVRVGLANLTITDIDLYGPDATAGAAPKGSAEQLAMVLVDVGSFTAQNTAFVNAPVLCSRGWVALAGVAIRDTVVNGVNSSVRCDVECRLYVAGLVATNTVVGPFSSLISASNSDTVSDIAVINMTSAMGAVALRLQGAAGSRFDMRNVSFVDCAMGPTSRALIISDTPLVFLNDIHFTNVSACVGVRVLGASRVFGSSLSLQAGSSLAGPSADNACSFLSLESDSNSTAMSVLLQGVSVSHSDLVCPLAHAHMPPRKWFSLSKTVSRLSSLVSRLSLSLCVCLATPSADYACSFLSLESESNSTAMSVLLRGVSVSHTDSSSLLTAVDNVTEVIAEHWLVRNATFDAAMLLVSSSTAFNISVHGCTFVNIAMSKSGLPAFNLSSGSPDENLMVRITDSVFNNTLAFLRLPSPPKDYAGILYDYPSGLFEMDNANVIIRNSIFHASGLRVTGHSNFTLTDSLMHAAYVVLYEPDPPKSPYNLTLCNVTSKHSAYFMAISSPAVVQSSKMCKDTFSLLHTTCKNGSFLFLGNIISRTRWYLTQTVVELLNCHVDNFSTFALSSSALSAQSSTLEGEVYLEHDCFIAVRFSLLKVRVRNKLGSCTLNPCSNTTIHISDSVVLCSDHGTSFKLQNPYSLVMENSTVTGHVDATFISSKAASVTVSRSTFRTMKTVVDDSPKGSGVDGAHHTLQLSGCFFDSIDHIADLHSDSAILLLEGCAFGVGTPVIACAAGTVNLTGSADGLKVLQKDSCRVHHLIASIGANATVFALLQSVTMTDVRPSRLSNRLDRASVRTSLASSTHFLPRPSTHSPVHGTQLQEVVHSGAVSPHHAPLPPAPSTVDVFTQCQPFLLDLGDETKWQLEVYVSRPAPHPSYLRIRLSESIVPGCVAASCAQVALFTQRITGTHAVFEFAWNSTDLSFLSRNGRLLGSVCLVLPLSTSPSSKRVSESEEQLFLTLARHILSRPSAYLPHSQLWLASSFLSLGSYSVVHVQLRDEWKRPVVSVGNRTDIVLLDNEKNAVKVFSPNAAYVMLHHDSWWHTVTLSDRFGLSDNRVHYLVVAWYMWLVLAAVVVALASPFVVWLMFVAFGFWRRRKEARMLRLFPLKGGNKKVHMELPPRMRVDAEDLTILQHNLLQGGQGTIAVGFWKNAKVVVKSYFQTASEAFVRETELLFSIRHPNIVAIMGAMLHPTPAVVMEFLPRGSVDMAISNTPGLLTELVCLRIICGTCRAMAYLHSNQVLHLDLKSPNVLIDDDFTPKVTDFGLSRALQAEPQMTSGWAGTARWMAPEVMNKQVRLTPACDVYSFCSILWELAALRTPPYPDTEWDYEVVDFVRTGVHPVVPSMTPAWMVGIMLSGWDMDPTARPTMDTILEVVEAQVRKHIPPERTVAFI
eukprot:CAMPEP_0177646038 /NCGR_PEP_ID=MMETSP0447-20121125/9563_1 /TAXON_ID=0 /ORGANISM="Stygamoeba regulata, Strain BSH-02190019" /LENGTH=1506 /DNA_ID=CAMNT_0019148549 /DNA_START=280 /DNA_END=4800 /DNA_ORIENTATION=-